MNEEDERSGAVSYDGSHRHSNLHEDKNLHRSLSLLLAISCQFILSSDEVTVYSLEKCCVSVRLCDILH